MGLPYYVSPMIGFFTKAETQSAVISKTRKSCFICGLQRNATLVPPYGNFKKGIMIIGEFPGDRDDARGRPWQGREGRLLQKTLEKIGVDLFEDCISMYALSCFPKDKQVTGKEIDCCREMKVLNALKEYQPKIVLLLGMVAVTSVIGARWDKSLGGIGKWRGWTIPDQEYNAWICPTFALSYVSSAQMSEVNIIWKQDLIRAISLGDLVRFKKPKIHYIEDLEVLRTINTKMAAFDYETTGLKPYFKGHRIVCASVAYDQDNAYTFIMPKKKSLREPFIEFLQNKKIKKIASNMKYEDQWSLIRLQKEVKGWFHDTMLTAHVLDNRPGITGLKFQAFVKMGVIEYDAEVSNYISKSRENGNRSNAINMIYELLEQPGGEKELLKYCALDSIYEYRLAQIQIKELNEFTRRK